MKKEIGVRTRHNSQATPPATKIATPHTQKKAKRKKKKNSISTLLIIYDEDG